MKFTKSTLFLAIGLCAALLSCNGQQNIAKGKIGGFYEISADGKEYNLINSTEKFYLDTLSYISYDDFEGVTIEANERGSYDLGFILNNQGAVKFKQMTKRNLNKQVCIVIQNEVIISAQIINVIENGEIVIDLNDEEEANELVDYLTN
ncbi:MAG: preprotein translocase subunit SecD [Flavobacteriaceae bacterium]|jgi:preprotein translocase subunit SecD